MEVDASCQMTAAGCPSDSPIWVWESIAEDRGFETMPDDFYDFAHFACIVEISQPPDTVEALAATSDRILLGNIAAIVPETDTSASFEEAEYAVMFQVEVEDMIKGPNTDTVLVNEGCAHAGKIAGLINARPDERLLFLLEGPYQPYPDRAEDAPPVFSMSYYYLGMVREQRDGLRWAYGTESEPALDDFDSLDALADALR